MFCLLRLLVNGVERVCAVPTVQNGLRSLCTGGWPVPARKVVSLRWSESAGALDTKRDRQGRFPRALMVPHVAVKGRRASGTVLSLLLLSLVPSIDRGVGGVADRSTALSLVIGPCFIVPRGLRTPKGLRMCTNIKENTTL